MALWRLAERFVLCVLTWLVSNGSVKWILSSISITLLTKRKLAALLFFFGLLHVRCLSWFVCSSLGVIGRQKSLIVALPGHLSILQ